MRILKHLFAPSAKGTFPTDSLKRIHDAIADDERRHRGEICFAVESALHWRDVWNRVDSRQRAEAAFAQLRVWDTEANNGVLVYLLLADHRIEIVADRGLHELVSAEQWRGICQLMEERMKAGEPEDAVMRGVTEIGSLLATHFPQIEGEIDHDELPNAPVILR
ncbi:TPM domain-containing protein [Solilutibacter tolerans]|uniref:TLP18.3, Psb32 and MOLO-1 founding protein of phosphatase n=1 Tax=Solilutibacter tolerans TaxID=1604334 RepID=A0A1N6TVC4_9GAMM|nr:TPM domain-containing protein [Lysobacter tolerans]SIQ57264.1 TLP18.3, Psb32 and MOLO-1 founding protein of phosphatase [Lysobacter tolerans]